MNVEYLIQLLGNRLNALNTAKEQSFLTGDLERINSLDVEINGVLDTLNKLRLLEGISQTALVTPFTEAEVVQNGIEASFSSSNTVNTITDPTGIMLGYDISSYATDPLHEEKITDILNYIGEMDTIEKIDAYIKEESIGSPIAGYMVYNSAQKYSVDIRLMLALMELDSRFGTVGIAIKTLNPGNIGNNDDGETRTYESWDEGVDAVAKWLDNHRIDMPMLLDENISPAENVTETIVETNENGDVTTTTTTTTTSEDVVDPVSDTVVTPPTDSTTDQTVSAIKRRRKIA